MSAEFSCVMSISRGRQGLPERLVVMYHSIDGVQPAVTGSFPISFDRFRKQISLLREKGYQFKPISALRETVPTGEYWAFITGDDGTVDWSQNVLLWCEEQEISTLTGVISGVWEGLYPFAHVLQVVLVVRPRKMLEKLVDTILEQLTKPQIAYIDKIYMYEKDLVRRYIKGGCNLILSECEAWDLVNPLSDSELQHLSVRFEKPEFYKQLGHAQIAVHTHTHTSLGCDVEHYIQKELIPSEQCLNDFEIDYVSVFVQPMQPRFNADKKQFMKLMKRRGYWGCLTSSSGVWNGENFEIPRVDGNKLENFLGCFE